MRRRRNRPSDSVPASPSVTTYRRRPALIQVYPPKRVLIDLRQFEDRRRYHPLREMQAAGVLDRREARMIIERDKRSDRMRRDRRYDLNPLDRFKDYMPSFRLGFKFPDKVVKCVRRQQRREVIFALKKRGKGSRALRRRRDEFSDISCKRT